MISSRRIKLPRPTRIRTATTGNCGCSKCFPPTRGRSSRPLTRWSRPTGRVVGRGLLRADAGYPAQFRFLWPDYAGQSLFGIRRYQYPVADPADFRPDRPGVQPDFHALYQDGHQRRAAAGQGCSNVMLLVLMPAFSLFITFTVPGGVGIYWDLLQRDRGGADDPAQSDL